MQSESEQQSPFPNSDAIEFSQPDDAQIDEISQLNDISKPDDILQQSEPEDVTSSQRFEEVVIGDETFCLVPKAVSKYTPAASTEVQELDGIGLVEIGNKYIYVPISLLPKVHEAVANSVDLQEQVTKCRTLLWSKYGKSDDLPHLIYRQSRKYAKLQEQQNYFKRF